MQRLSTRPKYTYKHGDVSFIFDSFTYESGTKVSDYEILTNGLSSAINGALPTKITLKGKFLADDYAELENYIFSNVGEVISQISINDRVYSRMTLLSATVSLPESSHIGDMTFILQRVV